MIQDKKSLRAQKYNLQTTLENRLFLTVFYVHLYQNAKTGERFHYIRKKGVRKRVSSYR